MHEAILELGLLIRVFLCCEPSKPLPNTNQPTNQQKASAKESAVDKSAKVDAFVQMAVEKQSGFCLRNAVEGGRDFLSDIRQSEPILCVGVLQKDNMGVIGPPFMLTCKYTPEEGRGKKRRRRCEGQTLSH